MQTFCEHGGLWKPTPILQPSFVTLQIVAVMTCGCFAKAVQMIVAIVSKG